MKERKEFRREREKHFENADHSFTAAVYGQPVHYMENGEWREIDNTVELGADGRYENKKNDFKVSFAKEASDEKLITVTKDGYKLSWRMMNALNAAVHPGKKSDTKKKKADMAVAGLNFGMAYKNVLDGMDLEYELRSKTLKENIVLNKPPVGGKIMFEIATNLIPETDGGCVLFKTIAGEEVFVMATPFMFDAVGKESHAIEVLCEGKREHGKFIYTLIPDEKWLMAEERRWPVTIDPVISTPVNFTSISDARVSSRYPNDNFGTTMRLIVGQDVSVGISRSLVNFTLPTLRPADMIIGAFLNLYCYSNYRQSSQVHVHRILESWNQYNVTWNNMPTYDNKIAECQIFEDKANEGIQFDVTEIVKDWYTNGNAYGLLLKDSQEAGDYVEFWGADNSDAIDIVRPRVYIKYVNYTGIQNFWTYHSQDVNRAGKVYVNDYNGNLVYKRALHSISGNRMPYSLELVYNSNEKNEDIGYGRGFRMNYHQTISEKIFENVSYYEWIDGTGTHHYFKQDGQTGKWMDELNNELELTIGTTAAEKYVISSKKNYKLIFNSNGLLVKEQDVNGNTLTVAYNAASRISSVTDGVGRSVNVTYDEYDTMIVTDPAGRSVWCNVFNGCLNGFQDYDGKTCSLEYENGLIVSVNGIDSYHMVYEYTENPARVKRIKEYAGGTLQKTLDIEYGFNINKFTDDRGRSEYYLFDNAGHTVSIKNNKGYAQVTEYIKDGVFVNKLSQVSKLQHIAPQYLVNPNLFDSSGWTASNGTGVTASFNTDADFARCGTRSLKLVSTSTSGTGSFNQKVTLTKGKTYVFSGFVRTENEMSGGTGGAFLRVVYKNNAGTTQNVDSRKVVSSFGDWTYIEATFTLPSNASTNVVDFYVMNQNFKGTAYFDSLHLEDGKTGNRRNLIENNDFTYGLNKFSRSSTLEDRDKLVDMSALVSEGVQQVLSGTVNADVLNVRSGPGTNYSTKGSISNGQMVTILDTVVGGGYTWYYVGYAVNGAKNNGYVVADFINVLDDDVRTGTVNADMLNMRAGAGTGNTVLMTLPYGTIVQIIGSVMVGSVEWYNIKAPYEGGMLPGYVSAEYITEITSTSTGNLAVDMEDVSVNTGTLNSTAMRMVGIPTLEKSLSQTINIAGKANDVFVISGWGCGNPLPMNQAEEGENQRRFGLELEFTYTDGTKKQFYADFMSDSNQWQYANKVIIAEKDFSAIKAGYVYNYNANNAYFDGLSLFKDEYWPSFTYDDNGNVISCTDAKKQKIEFSYDMNNNVTNIEMPTGADFTYIYGNMDHPHWVTEAVSATGKKYLFEYDEKGNVKSCKIVDSNNVDNYIKSTYEYTENFNYPLKNEDYFGNEIIFKYDSLTGNLEQMIDANNKETNYIYDEMGRLLSVSKKNYASGYLTDIVQTYTYENDHIKKLHRSGIDYVFSYDAFGNVTEVRVGTQILATNNYKMKGTQLDKALVGNGQGVSFEYDEYDRMIKKMSVKNDGTSELMFEYIYNNEGCLAYVIDHVNNDKIHYTYSLAGKLESVEHKNGQIFRYIYDQNDCLSSIEYAGQNDLMVKKVSYEYDGDFREVKTTTLGGKTLTTTYDALGRMTRQMFDITNMHATTYGYLEAVDGSQTPIIGVVRPGGMEFTYQYHNDGNIKQIETPWTTESFEYDFLGQLTRANNNDTGETILYMYDEGMNMISEEVFNYTTAGEALGTPIRQRTFEYDSVWKDRMVSCGGKALTYDAAGNLTSYDGTNFTWSNGRQLTGVTTADGVHVTYSYDHNGKRVSKIVDGIKTEYFYNGELLMRQKSPTVDMKFTYDSVGNLVAVMYNGIEYYYVKNLQGDIIGLVNDQSTMVVDYSYYLWGNHRSIFGQLASTLGQDNPFRYRGYYYDIETELYYIGSRYYNTEMCRFICPDKTSVLYAEPMKLTSKNLYSYCDNNPVSKTDLNGEIGIAATIFGSVALNLGTYVLSTAILNAAGVEDAEISATGVACAIVSGVATGATAAAVTALALKGGAKMAATLFASTVDSVCAAISTLIDTGKYDYAIFSGMASAAFSLGSLPGMMSLLDIEEYIPAVERTMLEVYVGTSKNTVIDYTMSGTSSGGKTNSGTSRSNSNKSNWPIVQSKTNSKGFDMTSILLPSTREQMKDFNNKILAVY